MKKHPLSLLLALAVLMAACASPVRGIAIVNATETGGNVVFAGGGTFNLTGLSLVGQGGYTTVIQADAEYAIFGANPLEVLLVDVYGNLVSPGPFGPGANTTFFADLGSGDRFGVPGTRLIVPTGYLSGTPLTASNTYSGMTFASMGLAPGSYTWSWGSGLNADSFTLNIIDPVPEPSTWAMLALGCPALLARRRRKA